MVPLTTSSPRLLNFQSESLPVMSLCLHFYVTPLDSLCSIVLGYNWLTRYNPLIDWVSSSIIFPASCIENFVSNSTSLRATVSEELETTDTTKPHDYDSDFHDSESHDSQCYKPDTPASMNPPNHAKIDIALVNAVAYQHACQLSGSQSFSITLSNGETLVHMALALAENQSTSPASLKNTMTSLMCSATLKPTNYHLIDLTI